ncbi:methyltransferase domain-containing protein [Ningiella sp. W23]|uniref:methyltransferase domain-containing protein n=1 Tax=Ningiella sp. W23 TaxID=3023715 RepID=UPI00375777FD
MSDSKINRAQSGSFDGIANKFDRNIYGTTKGRLRHLQLLHFLKPLIHQELARTVLDAGAGTGIMSLEFAQNGHHTTLVDVSDDALTLARQRLKDFPECQFIKQSLEDYAVKALASHKRFDIILCHAVLEWLVEPLCVLDKLIEQLNEGGVLSLSFFNHDAMLFNNAIYGNFEYIDKGMKVRNVVRLNPHNPQSPKQVLTHLAKRDDVTINIQAGLRCFHDYMREPSMQESKFAQLLALEKQYSVHEPYMWLGKYFYLQLQKC